MPVSASRRRSNKPNRRCASQLALWQLRESRELDLAVQTAKLAVMQAKAKQAETDRDRLSSLRKLSDPLVSDQQVEQQSVLLEVARSEQQVVDVGRERSWLSRSIFSFKTREADQQAAERALRLAEAARGIKTLEQQRRLVEIKLQQTQVTRAAHRRRC